MFLVISISQRVGCTDLPREAIGTFGDPIASRGGSVPVFLRKPIATCDFPGGWSETSFYLPLDLRMNGHS